MLPARRAALTAVLSIGCMADMRSGLRKVKAELKTGFMGAALAAGR
jgi:hypothetical protein